MGCRVAPTMTRAPYDAIAEHCHALRTTLQPKEAECLTLLLDPLPAGSTVLDLENRKAEKGREAIVDNTRLFFRVDSAATPARLRQDMLCCRFKSGVLPCSFLPKS